MMYRRAAGQAAKRGLLVWLAAVVVVMIGLIVFSNRQQMPDWLWRLEAARGVTEILR